MTPFLCHLVKKENFVPFLYCTILARQNIYNYTLSPTLLNGIEVKDDSIEFKYYLIESESYKRLISL